MNKRITWAIISLVIVSAGLILAANFANPQEFKYDSRGKRDPFVPLIGPDRAVATDLDDITSIDDVRLEGIAVGAQGKKVAMVNGEMLKEGEKIGSFEIKTITKTAVTFMISGKEYNLRLPEEGGAKSEK